MNKNTKASHAQLDPGGVNPGVAIIGFLLCFLAGAAVMWGYEEHRLRSGAIASDTSASSASPWDDSDSPIALSSKDPVWGKRDAPVTIVIFSDFQCPYCSRVEPTLDQVRQTYGPEKVRIAWKNFPLSFHANAKPAAEAAQGVFALAGGEGFWRFHDVAFKNQGELGADSYLKWAKDAGVKDLAAYKAGLDAHKWADKVDADLNAGKAAGVQGTPWLFVNGTFVNGGQPFDSYRKLIDAEMQKAQSKLASGTSRDRIYVEMTKDNRKAAQAAAPTKDAEDDKEDTKTVFRIPLGSAPSSGSLTALVNVVEFSDFQCPYCARVEPTLRALRDKYGDKLRIYWRNEVMPFHPRAEPAAQLAMEAWTEKGNSGFWDAHDRLFEAQKDLSDDVLAKIAADMGLSADRVKNALANHTHKKELDADQDLVDDFQANGTPHFFINGRRLVGMQAQEKFEKIIDEEIAKARELIAHGTRPSDVYEALTKDGKGPPPPETRDVSPQLPANDPGRGSSAAKVTIHEFSDFQCPFCGRVEPTVTQVMKDYGDRVRFVWHDLPLPMHADAPLAAQAAREAFKQKGPGAFWAMHDKMFADQQHIKREDLDGYARGLSLNMDKWSSALDGGSHTSEIDADKTVAAAMQITATPAFVVAANGARSGYFFNGQQSYGKFRKAIERAFADAAR